MKVLKVNGKMEWFTYGAASYAINLKVGDEDYNSFWQMSRAKKEKVLAMWNELAKMPTVKLDRKHQSIDRLEGHITASDLIKILN